MRKLISILLILTQLGFADDWDDAKHSISKVGDGFIGIVLVISLVSTVVYGKKFIPGISYIKDQMFMDSNFKSTNELLVKGGYTEYNLQPIDIHNNNSQPFVKEINDCRYSSYYYTLGTRDGSYTIYSSQDEICIFDFDMKLVKKINK